METPSLLMLVSAIFLTSVITVYFLVREKRLKKQMKVLEDKLLQQDNNLEGKAKFSELGLMSAGITHEINNPLTIIQTKVTYLLRIYRNPDAEKELTQGLQQILYTSERIARTIQGVRDFIYQGDESYEEKIQVKDIINNVLVFCGQRLKNHGIELRLIGMRDVTIKGHRVQLEQAFLNLINNAFDAVDGLPNKWIEISALETRHSVEIYFKDSGSGISEALTEKIMEPFFTTKGTKGTGLGLALVKGIAQKHHGSLSYVHNSENTTFLLEIPKSGLGRVPTPLEETPVFH